MTEFNDAAWDEPYAHPGYRDGYWDGMAGRTFAHMPDTNVDYAAEYARGHGEGQRRRNEANVR